MGTRQGTPQPPEARAKIAAALRIRWQDPVYRERQIAILRECQARGTRAARGVCKFLPPRGTKERREYEKIRVILGAKAARAALELKGGAS